MSEVSEIADHSIRVSAHILENRKKSKSIQLDADSGANEVVYLGSFLEQTGTSVAS